MIGYSLYFGSTSDNTSTPHVWILAYMLMIFYPMVSITIFPDLFHMKHSFSIYTYLCLPITSVWISTLVSAPFSLSDSAFQIRTLCAISSGVEAKSFLYPSNTHPTHFDIIQSYYFASWILNLTIHRNIYTWEVPQPCTSISGHVFGVWKVGGPRIGTKHQKHIQRGVLWVFGGWGHGWWVGNGGGVGMSTKASYDTSAIVLGVKVSK